MKDREGATELMGGEGVRSATLRSEW